MLFLHKTRGYDSCGDYSSGCTRLLIHVEVAVRMHCDKLALRARHPGNARAAAEQTRHSSNAQGGGGLITEL